MLSGRRKGWGEDAVPDRVFFVVRWPQLSWNQVALKAKDQSRGELHESPRFGTRAQAEAFRDCLPRLAAMAARVVTVGDEDF